MRIQDILKKQNRTWLYVGLAGVGAVLIFFLMRGSGGSAQIVQTGPSEGLQVENLRAQTALQQAQIAAGVQSAGIAAELQAMTFQGQLAGEIAGLEADTRLALAAMQTQGDLAGLEASLAALEIQSMTQRAISFAEIGAQRDVQIQAFSTQEAMTAANMQGQVIMQQIAAESMIAQQSISAELMSNLERQRNEVEIARIEGQTRQAQISAGAQRSGQRTNLIGSVIGGALSLFSDVRKKENIRWLGIRDDGLNVYSWTYADTGEVSAGVMAQEVMMYKPEAVHNNGKFLAVDYGAI